ncbi:MAG: glycerol-3-phosphate 1-O-acyltransferase PlsY [Methylotenera sp.]|jgi:glycerol-3-phosphate acyltransferase PlsY|uniref:glycerol-3-phosphate 1-O-acyltransferase PlsY n=1 Tax=Methylotenera sp. TaxID=2051956 RepID=UPI0027292EC0|nr:glycerol-3-phosphate 1-O-acyltransferase PlsY [Methylotenera sp.]MDO9394312.1 glycerol-3-phosphate 1-O-acyltransferase PlsY [Methylotenera sp.]MDP1524138.1 glycerol-3-phosphate 1-O-acyltransferase PlsY [Methylotenera sp.]MDP2231252.1 glycerol-3-phosphate 1-O-acyltransferase PlsY [Methylotenera sp.]MDP3140382.1 glycerol-3-phosphate 1-O-acyltransferase PlsY [Methylotenera sp.]MDP3308180.1 glycerol-3-phosphate 1-O-acyltransferase PlsY [Methylotenera sp.]
MNELGFIPVTLIPVIWIVAAYLLGSVAFGIIVSKLFGLPDPRTVGSGNPGATNVLRSGKKLAAALTLLGDVLKGWIPVWLALRSDMLMWVVASVGLAVFIGHLYPIFYKFKGGKGVATALGVMLALSPLLGLAAIVTWVLVFAIFRYSSLAAIMAAALAPVYAWFLLSAYKDYFITVLVMAVFLIWRHKTNIEKLLTGTESGFGKK